MQLALRQIHIKFVSSIFILLLSFASCDLAHAVTDSFQKGTGGYTTGIMARIFDYSTNQHATDNTNMNTANGQPLIVGHPLTSIPTTANVSSATIKVKANNVNCSTRVMQVKAIENPDNSGLFDEAGSASNPFNNHATYAFKDHDAGIHWSVGEANNFGDVDDNAAEDSQTILACNGYDEYTFDVTNMVQGWVSNPNSNAGLFFDCTTTCNIAIRGNYYSTVTDRPILTVIHDGGSGGGGTQRRIFYL